MSIDHAKGKTITTIGARRKTVFVFSAIGYGGTSSNSLYACMKEERKR